MVLPAGEQENKTVAGKWWEFPRGKYPHRRRVGAQVRKVEMVKDENCGRGEEVRKE